MTNTGSQLQITRVVVFRLGDQRYALPVEQVQEIQQIVRPTQVPDTWPALLGMIDLRGRVLPLLDMRRLLGLEAIEYDLQTPMIISRSAALLAALVVDGVDDVVDVPPDSIQPPSGIYELADKMLGVCRLDDGLVFILDGGRLLPEDQAAAVAQLAEEGV